MTLLDIYTLHATLKHHEFYEAVKEYGVLDFANDIATDENGESEPCNTFEECYEYLKTFIDQNEKEKTK